jgi:hypothetical protein
MPIALDIARRGLFAQDAEVGPAIRRFRPIATTRRTFPHGSCGIHNRRRIWPACPQDPSMNPCRCTVHRRARGLTLPALMRDDLINK